MKKIVLIEAAVLGLLLTIYGIYKWQQANQPVDFQTQLLLEAGRTHNYYASLKRKDNELILNNINILLKEVEANLGVKLEYASGGNRIVEHTNKILTKIEQVRKDVITAAGGMENNQIKGGNKLAKYDKKNFLEMIAAIDPYLDTLSKIGEINKPLVMYNSKGDTLQPHQFASQFFVQKPLALFLYNLSRLETDIILAENEAMLGFGKKANYMSLEFNDMVAVITPLDAEIKEGEEYKAEIQVKPIITSHKPSGILVEDKPIQIENGIGKVRISPSGKLEKEGNNMVKNWEAIYLITTQNGTTTYSTKDKFYVEK
ncbi:MAG: hypothetical protein OHK0038_05740 [Flammeovirgaceae bacterium]